MSKPFCGSGGLPAGVRRPYLVCITGSRGTGKSLVGKILQEQHGASVIDTDHITHWLLESPGPAYNEVLAAFGEDLAPVKDGPIDRAALAARALRSDDGGAAKARLEAIMFPRINERLEALIAEQAVAGSKIVFVLAPMLHEFGLQDHFDEIWCVVAKESVRLARLMARDGLTEAEALRLIKLQMSQTEKARLSHELIDNSFTAEKTAERVAELLAAVLVRVEAYYATSSDAPVEDAPATDTTGKEGGDPLPKPDGDETGSDSRPAPEGDANARYRRILRQAAEIGTDETLSKLGNVADTQHQEASARMSLVVDRSTDGENDLGRQLDVEVKMSVRNQPGKTPVPGGCSCGCGDRCRVDCACQPDCGCGCKKPSPPPPPPVDPDCGNHGGKSRCLKDRFWLLVLAVIALFGLLAFLYAWNHPHKDGSNSVTIINNIPPCTEKCKPTEPPVVVPPVVVPPFNPPAQPPADCGETQVLNEVPGFAFRFTHNVVRDAVVRWEVKYGSGCQGAQVTGFDADKRLLVYQEYDSHQYMTKQLVINYLADGSVQVDRFEGRANTYTGRSIYRYNSTGSVVRAEHYSAARRLQYVAVFVRNGSGTTVALNVEEFDPVTGAVMPKRTIEGTDSASEFLRSKFLVFSWYGQL